MYLSMIDGNVSDGGIVGSFVLAKHGKAEDKEFLDTTMIGRIHHTIDWLHAGYFHGDPMASFETSEQTRLLEC